MPAPACRRRPVFACSRGGMPIVAAPPPPPPLPVVIPAFAAEPCERAPGSARGLTRGVQSGLVEHASLARRPLSVVSRPLYSRQVEHIYGNPCPYMLVQSLRSFRVSPPLARALRHIRTDIRAMSTGECCGGKPHEVPAPAAAVAAVTGAGASTGAVLAGGSEVLSSVQRYYGEVCKCRCALPACDAAAAAPPTGSPLPPSRRRD